VCRDCCSTGHLMEYNVELAVIALLNSIDSWIQALPSRLVATFFQFLTHVRQQCKLPLLSAVSERWFNKVVENVLNICLHHLRIHHQWE